MIPLQISADPLPIIEPMVLRLRTSEKTVPVEADLYEGQLVSWDENFAEFDVAGFSLQINSSDVDSLDGDVVLAIPGRRSLHRLIRRNSVHNTLLVTEQCDQKCIMCSQPPKKNHTDMFDHFFDAIRLAPRSMTIGLSGGEPFLHKSRLFDFLKRAQTARPDISFHILTNGQHFDKNDAATLQSLDLSSILWGIPIYSADAGVHDRIVVKEGAFDRLQENLALLGSLGASIELRTVVLNSNIGGMQQLAAHVTTHQSFTNVWAIMQLENIGFARMNWDREFYDSSVSFNPIADGIDLAAAKGMKTSLYNFPLCTVPPEYRINCVASISDWKQKFLADCGKCKLRSNCGGFFEWYPEKQGFAGIHAQ
jgi:His-Xaa-Ser system radical SAM maturase HxsC